MMTLEDLLPLLEYMHDHRGERMALHELARRTGVSASKLQRAFSRIVGESPKQFNRRLQLERAITLLVCTRASVLEVALASGFESHEGFTRAFHQHVGTSPRAFRAESQARAQDWSLHAHIIDHTGPCVRLFRHLQPRGVPMNYDITLQRVPAMTTLYQRARCTHADVGQTLGELLPAVFTYATQNHIAMLGHPVVRYLEWGPGMVTLEAGIPVVPGAEGAGDIEVATLPEVDAAVTIHTGSYDGLGDAHVAVEIFLHEQGKARTGPTREVFLTDPGEVPNPEEWKTQIVWPCDP